ncbi:RlpA-like double-psi beta-barrel-protein domain-containing protein-containing protein [Mycena metata]|uniref:RlpA-like double-psi beta-barrel-protein domain-containing protein-containing protein n=1 Tax=Mycena metata TaxID=1033252 RepID=A0AAD7KJJ4_9AGAR|nr:RlpA-like double-psi beta-barrel-protein domain-containing protein-containing protein [Mycena metata]
MFILSLLQLVPVVLAVHHVPRHPKRADAHTGDKEFSFYDVGLGACGGTNVDSDFVVAINVAQWDGGANCNKEIIITYNGKEANAKVVDQCMGCLVFGLDLSPSLFDFFADEDLGRIHGEWSFADSTPEQSSTTSKATSTTATTSSVTSKIQASASTSKTTTVSTARMSSSVSAVSTSVTSSAAVPTSSHDAGPQNLAMFNSAVFNLLRLVVQRVDAKP